MRTVSLSADGALIQLWLNGWILKPQDPMQRFQLSPKKAGNLQGI